MNARNPATDKIQITDVPMTAPAHCGCCGAVDRPVVDFGLTIDYYGAVLICTACMHDAAIKLGYITREQMDANNVITGQILDNQDKVKRLFEESVSEIERISSDLGNTITNILFSGPVANKKESEGTATDSSQSISGSKSDSPTFPEITFS